MGRISWPVLGTALLFDTLALGLACGALARRSTGAAKYAEPGYLTCVYTKDTSTGLAAAAFVFLLFGQLLISVVTKCFCCGRETYKPGFSRLCAILLLILSWLTFILAECLLLAGAIVNNVRTTGVVDQGVVSADEVHCRAVKKAIFASAVAFTFLTILFSLVYYHLQTKAEGKDREWTSYRGEADPYSMHDGPTVGMTAYN